MRHYITIFALAVTAALCMFSACSSSVTEQPDSPQAAQADTDTVQAYYAADFDGKNFWAVGSDGKITRISADNQPQDLKQLTENDLNDLWIGEGKMLACGDGGTILYSAGQEQFQLVRTDCSANLNAATSFRGRFFVGGEDGLLMTSSDGVTWEPIELPVKNSIIGLAANEAIILAITEETDYLISTDGSAWEHRNYNQEYEGYADPCIFRSLQNMGESFFVVGQMAEHPDLPFVMYTESGEVWFHKPLAEINGMELSSFAPLKVNSIDCSLDQLVAACDEGGLLTVTNCAECNELGTYADADLYDLVFGGEKLLIVGEDYTHSVVDINDVRQYNIQPQQALDDYNNNGAVIIDVRSEDEWMEGHITDALHIPVEEIGTRLLQEVPNQNTQLIFYCSSGQRSQTALEEALKLGYQQVYNLGSIDEWPYGIE